MRAGALGLVTAVFSITAVLPQISGWWTYRSFHNNPALVGNDAQKALGLIFAEATFRFELQSKTTLKGSIDWDSGGLDLRGTIRAADGGTPLIVEMVGIGRPSTETDGWEYDYHAYLAHQWPSGLNQVSALTVRHRWMAKAAGRGCGTPCLQIA